MNLRHQRTCSIKDRQSKRGGFAITGAGNARGAENRARTKGDLIQALDKMGALCFN